MKCCNRALKVCAHRRKRDTIRELNVLRIACLSALYSGLCTITRVLLTEGTEQTTQTRWTTKPANTNTVNNTKKLET